MLIRAPAPGRPAKGHWLQGSKHNLSESLWRILNSIATGWTTTLLTKSQSSPWAVSKVKTNRKWRSSRSVRTIWLSELKTSRRWHSSIARKPSSSIKTSVMKAKTWTTTTTQAILSQLRLKQGKIAALPAIWILSFLQPWEKRSALVSVSILRT